MSTAQSHQSQEPALNVQITCRNNRQTNNEADSVNCDSLNIQDTLIEQSPLLEQPSCNV